MLAVAKLELCFSARFFATVEAKVKAAQNEIAFYVLPNYARNGGPQMPHKTQ